MAQRLRLYFTDHIVYDDKAAAKFLTAETAPLLAKSVHSLEGLPTFDEASIEQVFQQLLAETGSKLGAIAQPARAALTGDTVSPGIDQIMAILGRERAPGRLSQAMAWTASPHQPRRSRWVPKLHVIASIFFLTSLEQPDIARRV